MDNAEFIRFQKGRDEIRQVWSLLTPLKNGEDGRPLRLIDVPVHRKFRDV
jgi:hypothetical protein